MVVLIALAAGGGFYFYRQQLQKKKAEKEALDPDADYTENKGDFEIPTDVPDEDDSPDRAGHRTHLDFKAAFAAVHIQMKTD